MEDVNPYARNLILVSSAFILYTVLGLTPNMDDGSADINLLFMKFDIQRDEFLPYVSYVLLVYTIWKFESTLELYHSKGNSTDLISHIRRFVEMDFRQLVTSGKFSSQFLEWQAWRAYRKQTVEKPGSDIKHLYSRDSKKYELKVIGNIHLKSLMRVETNVNVGPIGLLDKDQRFKNLALIDEFTFQLTYRNAFPYFFRSYLKFIFFKPWFHSLVVPRVLYGAATCCVIYNLF